IDRSAHGDQPARAAQIACNTARAPRPKGPRPCRKSRGKAGGMYLMRSVRSTGLGLGLALAFAASFFAVPASAAAPCNAKTDATGDWTMYGHDQVNSRTQPVAQGIR